jgi:hypothetical protein
MDSAAPISHILQELATPDLMSFSHVTIIKEFNFAVRKYNNKKLYKSLYLHRPKIYLYHLDGISSDVLSSN